MPPGPRPAPAPKPRQTAFTQAVATQGRAAIDQRAQAASYGATGQQQALRDLAAQYNATGTGYSSHPGQTDAYAQWQQSQGFRPQAYPVGYGQSSEGKYAGFKTEGDLKAAVLGAAELQRERDLQQAQAMKQQAQGRLSDLGGQYDTSASSPMGASIASIAGLGARVADEQAPRIGTMLPGLDFSGQAGVRASATDRQARVAQAQSQSTGDYLSQLNDWYAKQAEPAVANMETANQISNTPTREYQFRSGAAYGVDPNLIAGWSPMAGQIADAAHQRDIESLNQTGLPYSEQQSTLNSIASDQTQQAQQSQQDQQVQMADAVYGATTYPGDALAKSTSLPLPVVYDITTSPNFPNYASAVEEARAAVEGDPSNQKTGVAAHDNPIDNAIAQAVDDAISQATDQVVADSGDPNTGAALERILRSLYGNI